MKKYLVIGNPIKHSLSPLIHNYWIKKYNIIQSVYEKEKVEEKDLEKIIQKIRNNKIFGVNVTVPFKNTIIPYLDELDHIATITQSVNTIHKVDNKIVGYNTDTLGFLKTMCDYFGIDSEVFFKGFKPENLPRRDFFVLGAGGVASSVINSLLYLVGNTPGKVWISNRTKEKAENLKNLFPQIKILDWGKLPPSCDVVINTTSVGLKKDDSIDLDFNAISKNALFYDLIYNPKETNFLKHAKLRGNKTINGQMMFLEQAKESFKIWTNITPEIDKEVLNIINND